MNNNGPAYQLLARGSGFLEAARIVVDASGNKTSLRAPVAHLIAHALEVLMKHQLLMSGQSLDDAKKYSHDLPKLWGDSHMDDFRDLVLKNAEAAWSMAKQAGLYEDDFSSDPSEVIKEHIFVLGRLHSHHSDYALRYVADVGEKAPNPLFLLDTLQPVKDELARKYSRDTSSQI